MRARAEPVVDAGLLNGQFSTLTHLIARIRVQDVRNFHRSVLFRHNECAAVYTFGCTKISVKSKH